MTPVDRIIVLEGDEHFVPQGEVGTDYRAPAKRPSVVRESTPWRFTDYFRTMRERDDRAGIRMEWIVRTAEAPEHQSVQADGRLRCWRRIPEAEGRWLRVVLLDDRRTIHNAFFDRGLVP
jgi:hypothetical protein